MHIRLVSRQNRVSFAQSASPELKAQLMVAIFEALASILPLVMQLTAEKEGLSA